jgi:formate-dependent nitrite reductase membrane component NrfD
VHLVCFLLLCSSRADVTCAAWLQLEIVVRDLSQPDTLQVPEYGGQIYIFGSVLCGVLFVAGSVVLAMLYVVVLWNARVAQGRHVPWWAIRAGRGW